MFGIDFGIAFSAAIGTFFGLFAKEWVSGIVRGHQRHEKARDDDVAEIVSSIDVVREIADQYWTQSAKELGSKEHMLRGRLVGGLHHINLLVANLFTNTAKRECDLCSFRFADAAGGGSFGNADREAEPERLSAVHSAALSLRHRVTMERRKLRYKPLA